MPEDQPTARRYAGLAGEERREQRRAGLVAATLELVGEVGVAELTVAGVCRRAGLSKRYFYEGFASLEDVVRAALETVLDRVARGVDQADLGPDAAPAAVLEAMVRAALVALEEPRASRLYVEAAAVPAARASHERALQLFVDQVLVRVAGPAYAAAPAQLLGHLLVSGTTHVVAMWLRGDLALSRDELVARLVDIGVAGLGQLSNAPGR